MRLNQNGVLTQLRYQTKIVTNVTLVKFRLMIWQLVPNRDGIYKLI